jgi:Protein of unknown function (DUF5818)
VAGGAKSIGAVAAGALAVAAGAALSARTTHQKPLKAWIGLVSDSECGTSHVLMERQEHLPQGDDRNCVLFCVRRGSEFVLADPVSGDVYQLVPQKGLTDFAGQRVRVVGRLETASGTIHVASVEAVRRPAR